MAVILGTGAYRYEVVDQWAKLPPGREFNADVAAVGVDTQDRVYAFNRGQPSAQHLLRQPMALLRDLGRLHKTRQMCHIGSHEDHLDQRVA